MLLSELELIYFCVSVISPSLWINDDPFRDWYNSVLRNKNITDVLVDSRHTDNFHVLNKPLVNWAIAIFCPKTWPRVALAQRFWYFTSWFEIKPFLWCIRQAISFYSQQLSKLAEHLLLLTLLFNFRYSYISHFNFVSEFFCLKNWVVFIKLWNIILMIWKNSLTEIAWSPTVNNYKLLHQPRNNSSSFSRIYAIIF